MSTDLICHTINLKFSAVDQKQKRREEKHFHRKLPLSMSKKLKVLVCGPVQGSFSSMAKKLQSLQKSKAGPFDLCLCVGPFFAVSSQKLTGDESERENIRLTNEAKCLLENHDNNDSKNSDFKMPLPVYFIDLGQVPPGINIPSSEKDNTKIKSEIDKIGVDAKFNGTKINENIFWLNGESADIVSLPHVDVNGNEHSESFSALQNTLIVGYVSPHATFTSSSMSMSPFEHKARHPSFLGCDILLTSDFGQGLLSSDALIPNDKSRLGNLLQDGLKPNEVGSYDTAEFAILARPRYHFAASSQIISFNHFTSLPFRNIAQSGSTKTQSMRSLHVSRFISLGSVLTPSESKTFGKNRKFLHALGISPILTINQEELSREPPETVNNPYTDEAYEKDFTRNESLSNQNLTSTLKGKLSEAHARRILVEQENIHSQSSYDEQYRWSTNKSSKKRSYVASEKENQQQKQAAEDPNNKCLFIHGLLKDPTLNGPLLLSTFQSFGCTKVRCLPNKNFGFVEFETHDKAQDCLQSFKQKQGEQEESGLVVNGTYLGLKWSSGGAVSSTNEGAHPTPGDHAVPPMKRPSKRQRLTETEAHDSDSLFFKLPLDTQPDHFEPCFEIIRVLMESSLEAAINMDTEGNERITAKDEPALAVNLRYPSNAQNNVEDASSTAAVSSFAFLVFASHAAASMAIASLTGHPDGGIILAESLQKYLPKNKLGILMSMTSKGNLNENLSLFWAKGKSEPKHFSKSQNGTQRYPKDSRTDCWFCLASPTCENHLIITVKESVYIAMPKGAMDDFHSLIIPFAHSYASNNEESDDNEEQKESKAVVLKEISSVKNKLADFARNVLKKELFIFERAVSTKRDPVKSKMYHTHIQCIPVEKDTCKKLENVLRSTAGKYDVQLKLLEEGCSDLWSGSMDTSELDTLNESGYFYAEVPTCNAEGSMSVKRFLYSIPYSDDVESCSQKLSVPLQFGREVLASALGKPEVVHWKACVVDETKETELAQKFRAKLSQFESESS